MVESSSNLPLVTISRRGADRIRAGHVWVYRSDVISAEGVLPGAVVLVQEAAGSGSPKHADKSVRATRAGFGREERGRGRAFGSAPGGRRSGQAPTHTLGSAFY